MRIEAIDHLVLVVLDIERTVAFYTRLLGMEARETVPGRWALHFGAQKINLQQLHRSVDPNTRHPSRGAGDFCLLTRTPIAQVVLELEAAGVPLVEGPIRRAGAAGPILSVYLYDPDENLVEIANPIDPTTGEPPPA